LWVRPWVRLDSADRLEFSYLWMGGATHSQHHKIRVSSASSGVSCGGTVILTALFESFTHGLCVAFLLLGSGRVLPVSTTS